MKAMRYGLIGLAVLLAGSAPVRAQERPGESLKDVLAQLAKKVTDVCEGLKPAQTSVAIGEFSGSQDALRLGVGGGSVKSELASVLGGFVKTDAALELNGQVFLVNDPTADGLKAIRIKAKLTNKNGDDVAEFKEFVGYVRNATDFARVTGATVAFKADGDYNKPTAEEAEKLKDEGKIPYDGTPSQGRRVDAQQSLPTKPRAEEKPKVVTAFVKGSVIRAKPESDWDVEVLSGPTAKGPFKELPATLTDKQFPGLPFVEIEQRYYYQVRVTNRSKVRLGIFLHLDGIDQFTFSEDRAKGNDKDKVSPPKFRFWVVDAGKTITIEGYHKNVKPGEVFGFLTTEAGKPEAEQAKVRHKFPTKLQGDVGTICVGLTRERVAGKGPQETIPGDVIRAPQKVTEFNLGDIDEFVTVRYSR